MNQETDKRPVVSARTEPQNGVAEIDLMELLYRLLAHWMLIVLCTVLGFILSQLYIHFYTTPMYQATSVIYVLSNSDSVINMSDLSLGSNITEDYQKVFTLWELHEQVISNLNLPYSYSQMNNMLSVTNDSNTRMLDITVTNADPELAAAIANEYAVVASNYIAETMAITKPSIMSVALVPSNPVSPSKIKLTVVGMFLGALAACGYVFIVMLLDDKIKTGEDIKHPTGMETLAIIPVDKEYSTRRKSDRRKLGGRK